MTFNVEIAKMYGVDEAILIENLFFWINKNRANNRHFYDGYYWTYNTAKAFADLFPFWSEKQVRRIIKSLKEKGVLLTGHHNKKAYDRTTWYALSNEIMSFYGVECAEISEDNNQQVQENETLCPNGQMEFPKRANGSTPNGQMEFPKQANGTSQTVTPIPDINTDINTDNKKITVTTSCDEATNRSSKGEQKSSDFKFEENSVQVKITKYLIAKITSLYPKAKVPETPTQIDNWAIHIDRMIRIDGRTKEEIAEVLKFATEDSFWQSHILSTEKLRKKFDTLFIQLKSKSQKGSAPKKNSFNNFDQPDYDYSELERKARERLMMKTRN